MNPIKLIRKLGKALRGGATSRDMFLGVFLGFAIGMIPGVNLTLVILIFLLLFLNANGALGALAIMSGKALSLLLAPVTFHVGYAMIHQLGLIGLVRATANTPVIALLDLHVYCLIGALPLVVVLGVPLGWSVARSIVKGRAGMAAASATGGKAQAVAGSKFARIALRVVFGKQTETFAEMTDKKSRLVRKGRLIAAAVVVLMLVVLQLLLLDGFVKTGLAKSIASASGAEVNIASADLSLGSGRLVIDGLQVTDPARPTHNQVQAERIVANVSIADLLARRLVIDLMACQALKTDVQRESPGEVYQAPDKPADDGPQQGLSDMLGASAKYYAEIKKFNERLGKLREHLESDDPKSEQEEATEPDSEALARRAKAEGYRRLSAKDYLAKKPTWVISELRVSKVEIQPDLPTFTIEGSNLSSHPSLVPEEAKLTARPDEDALKTFVAKASGGEAGGKLLGGLLGAGKKTGEEAGSDAASSDSGREKKGLFGGLLGGEKKVDGHADGEPLSSDSGTKKKGLLDGLLGK